MDALLHRGVSEEVMTDSKDREAQNLSDLAERVRRIETRQRWELWLLACAAAGPGILIAWGVLAHLWRNFCVGC